MSIASSISREKIVQALTEALNGMALTTGHGTNAGQVTGVMPTNSGGLAIYIKLDDGARIHAGGFSFEIPLHAFLPEGQFPVCPTVPGHYEVTLTNQAILRLDFRIGVSEGKPGTGEWFYGDKKVGTMHEVRLQDWRNPAVVVGVKLISTFLPSGQAAVVEETVSLPETVTAGS